MRLIVNPHKIEIIKNEAINEREIDVSKCEFEFSEEITNDFVKEAYFTFEENTYKQIIVNNECSFPSEVLEKKGQIEIGVVAYLIENEEEIKRYNPSPVFISTLVGSLKDNPENTEPITPSEMEQFEYALNNGLNDLSSGLTRLDDEIDDLQEKVNSGYFDGQDGRDGANGITPTIGDNGNWYLGNTDTGKPSRGEQGIPGEIGATGATGQPGRDGTNGVDGVSPIVTTSKSGSITTIEITDKNGTHTATINDGINGQNGANGFSPTVQTSKSGKTTTITITDATGNHTATILDGNDGQDGQDGSDYVLTNQDKQDIADIVLSELPDADEVSY